MSNQQFYDISESNIIRFIVYNDNFRDKAIRHLQPDLFNDGNCGDVFGIIKHLHNKLEPILESTITVLILNNPWKQTAELINAKLNLFQISEAEKDFYRQCKDISEHLISTENWWKNQMYAKLTKDTVEMFKYPEKRDLGSLEAHINTILSFDITAEKQYAFNPSETHDMIAHYMRDDDKILFNNPFINEVFDGGLKKKTLSLFMGGVHKGKTRLLLSMAIDLCRASTKNNVLYVSLEIDKMSISEKYDMNILNMTTKAIKEIVRKDAEEYMRLKEKAKLALGNLYIKEYSPNEFCAADLAILIESMKRAGTPITTVFVDYIQLMRPNESHGAISLFEKGVYVSQQLRSFAMKTEIPILGAIQPTRSGNNQTSKGFSENLMMDTGESKAMPDTCDFYATIVMTPQMKKEMKQIVYISKNRMGGITDKHWMLEFDKDLYISRIVGITSDEYLESQEPQNEGPYRGNKFQQKFESQAPAPMAISTQVSIGVPKFS